MATNQEARFSALVAIIEANNAGSSVNKSYNSVWHVFFDDEGIDPGSFNERMLAWCNAKLGASYTDVKDAMQAYAESEGAYDWDSLDTVTAIVV